LIGELPGFAFLGELRKLWQVGLPQGRSCGCGLPYDECPIWSVVLPKIGMDAAMPKRWQEVAAPDRRSSLHAWQLSRGNGADDADVAAYSELLGEAYRALSEATGARVLVDTSKLPADAVLVSRLPDIDAYFLELVRDPRGTVYSALRRGEGSAFARLRQTVIGSAGWLVRHAAARRLLQSVGSERAMVTTYERLVGDPDTVLAEVARFVGEPATENAVVIGGRADLGVAHTPIGGGRFKAVSVELSRDDRWVSSMSGTDRRVVGMLTWPLARRFGYGSPERTR
jgi:hypothetical protein